MRFDASPPPRAVFCDAATTARLLPYNELVEAVRVACLERAAGRISLPVRSSVPLGLTGVLLSMPASAADIAIHKLVSFCPTNGKLGKPTIYGQVTVCDGDTGEPLVILDGPTVTGRRTAAVTLLGISVLTGKFPDHVAIIGTGVQAYHHVQGLIESFPDARISVKGREATAGTRFCNDYFSANPNVRAFDPLADTEPDVVITLTASITPVYSEPARSDTLVIAVGAFMPDSAEIDSRTVQGSQLWVDDMAGARAEAGDLIQADVDWGIVRTLASAIGEPPQRSGPVLLKTVGCSAWDLAASRVALHRLRHR